MQYSEMLATCGIADADLTPIQGGLIHRSWKAETATATYLLQQINTNVFCRPEQIHENIRRVKAHLSKHHPHYLLPTPLPLPNGEDLLHTQAGECFRLIPFVQDAHSYAVAASENLAHEAAFQFGRLTSLLSDFDATILHETIPGFHDLSLRARQLDEAVTNAGAKRRRNAADALQTIEAFKFLEARFSSMQTDKGFPVRVMHHDAKISNVLFDVKDRGICVVDLDTLMPGRFISDVGDLLRTFLSPVSEEEQDLSRIEVRKGFYDAIVAGYSDAMGDALSADEKNDFVFAGQCMMYMQALRFLADYLNNDRYYGAQYPQHNLIRAQNQLMLLQRFSEAARSWQVSS